MYANWENSQGKVKMTFSYSARELWPTSTTRLSFLFPFSTFFFARASRFSSSLFFPPFFSFALVLSHDISLSWQISASFYFPSFPWSLSRSALLFISTLNYLLVLVCLSPVCPPSALSRSFKYLTSFSLKYLFEFKLTALLISLICTMQIFIEIHAQVTRIIDKKYSNYPKIYSFLIFRI